MPLPRPQPSPLRRAWSRLTGFSEAVGAFRWLFMPLGLFALVAVGIHAAADTVCERLLWAVDQLSAALDHALATFDLTAGLVGAISFSERTRIARGLTLLWELAADGVLAVPALGYSERALSPLIRPLDDWRGLLKRMALQPTTLRITRPLATLAMVMAGVCAIARMVQGSLYLELRGLLSEGEAGLVARTGAIVALAGIAAVLGWRAVLRSLEYADVKSETVARSPAQRFAVGLFGAALVAPLALAAALDASPILSFFR